MLATSSIQFLSNNSEILFVTNSLFCRLDELFLAYEGEIQAIYNAIWQRSKHKVKPLIRFPKNICFFVRLTGDGRCTICFDVVWKKSWLSVVWNPVRSLLPFDQFLHIDFLIHVCHVGLTKAAWLLRRANRTTCLHEFIKNSSA